MNVGDLVKWVDENGLNGLCPEYGYTDAIAGIVIQCHRNPPHGPDEVEVWFFNGQRLTWCFCYDLEVV